MIKKINKFKSHLARIKPGSFRYQMTSFVWKSWRLENTKACTFYWWYLPTSVLALAGTGIALAFWAIFTYIVIVPVTWLLGFTPEKAVITEVDDPDSWKWHGGYGYNPVTKRRHIIAYQHILLVFAGIVVLLFFADKIPWSTVITIFVGVVIGIGLGTLIGYLFTRKAAKEYWHRICPPLEILPDGE